MKTSEEIERKPLTEDQKQQIREMVEQGETQETIAKALNVSQSTVSRYRRKQSLCKKDNFTLKDLLSDREVRITQASVFFIKAKSISLNNLQNQLMSEFCETDERYGIVHIEQTHNPSGLLIFSNDHNLLQQLEYIKYSNDSSSKTIE